MEPTSIFNLALAEIDFKHPYLTTAKFVFADNLANENNQGIEADDFDEVIRSAIGLPVKMLYNGKTVGNHLGSYVIGHITGMEKVEEADGTVKLMAEALLYKDEFPEEINFLQKALAEGTAPGISYEIRYKDTIIKNGVQWLKNLATTAATFVRSPAYGKRTALLALASAKTDDEFNTKLLSIAGDLKGEGINPSNEGGNNVDELEKAKQEAADLKAEAETKQSEIDRLNGLLAEKDTEITGLNGKILTLENERTVEVRVRKLSDAGFPLEAEAEKADQRKAFILKMDDDTFEQYISDLSAVQAKAPKAEASRLAFASLKATPVLKPEVVQEPSGEVPSFRFNR